MQSLNESFNNSHGTPLLDVQLLVVIIGHNVTLMVVPSPWRLG
jgi:hypothetical protein